MQSSLAFARPVDLPDEDRLRVDYQEPAVQTALTHIASGKRNGIIRIFTGGGKTRTGIALVRRWLKANPFGRCLWIANRTFLIEDAVSRIYNALQDVSREQAAYRSSDTRVVVGSMLTLVGDRLREFPTDAFGLVIVDECQYLDSPSGVAIRDHFKNAAFVGLSATPGEAKAFGGLGSVIYSRDILWGIDEGYFVPIDARFENVTEIDVSHVKSSGGDLQIGDLEKAIFKASAPIARLAWEHCKDRQTIIYTPGVASAHAVAKIWNEYRPGSAVSHDAKTKPAERKAMLEAYDRGDIQMISNCGIYLFGLDVPACSAIVIARPTEDTDLWRQMVGRGGRPVPGIGELPTREQRIAAIAASKKPNMLLLVLSGEAGKHTLATPVDIDEEAPPEVKARAMRTLKEKPGTTVTDALKEAKVWHRGEYDKLVALAVRAKIQSEGGTFDPFAAAGLKDRAAYSQFAPAWTREPPTEAQQWWLRKNGLPTDVSRGEASKMRAKADKWELEKRASYTQRAELSRLGLPHDLPWQTAADLLFACPEAWVNGKRQRTKPAPEVVGQILAAELAPKKKGRR